MTGALIAPVAAAAGAATTSGGRQDAVAAGISAAAPGALPGPSTGEPLGPGPTGFAATLAERWNSSTCGTLALEAEALGVFNRALAHFMATPDTDKPAAWARALLFAGCSRPADELMIPMSKQGLLEHFLPTQQATSLGLRLAEQALVRMAHTNSAPRVVERLLALWAQEAVGSQGFVDRRVSERIAACDAGSVFAEQPALEHAVFSADMRASVRDAPLMAQYVLHGAMAAMLRHVPARPNDVLIGDALALHACKAAERRAEEALEAATAAAAAAAAGGAADARQQAVAAEAQAQAEEALQSAAIRVEAARAARQCECGGAPPGGPAGAVRRGGKSDNSDGMPTSESIEEAERERMLERMEHMAASDVSDSEYGYDTDDSDEAHMDLDDMDHDLACELDGEQTAGALADDRTTCACLPVPATHARAACCQLRVTCKVMMMVMQMSKRITLCRAQAQHRTQALPGLQCRARQAGGPGGPQDRARAAGVLN